MSEFDINLRSITLSGPVDITVLMPFPQFGSHAQEFYNSDKKYKVLWLLHGGDSDRHIWLHKTNIAGYVENRDVIVVMPNALNSDYANHPQFADGYNFSDFFFDELMPFIYNWFPASDKSEDNFITGFSMGAAGTWMYGLFHPEKFGGIAPIGSALKDYSYLEPYRNLTAAEFRAKTIENPKAFPAGYGNPAAGIHLKEVNMITKYPAVGAFLDSYEHTCDRFQEVVAEGKLPKVYMACSTQDGMYKKILKFKECVEKLGAIDITYEFEAHGNGYAYCDYIFPKMLDFFGIRVIN